MTITGNTERDSMLIEAIRQCLKEKRPLSVANVGAFLPADFDLIAKELTAARRALTPAPLETTTPAGTPLAPEPLENFEPLDVAEPQPADNPPTSEAPEADITYGQARTAVDLAHKRLSTAQVALIHRRQEHTDAKAALSVAITAWQRHGDGCGLSREQREQAEIRRHLAGEQQRRAAGPGPRMRPDKILAPGQMQFRGNRRGAFPAGYQHRSAKA
jgi:hypothetical protein